MPVWLAGGMAALAILAFVLMTPDIASILLGRPVPFDAFHGTILAWTAIWGALILGLRYGPEAMRRPFAWRPLRYVGVISFGLYLWHPVAIGWWRDLGLGLSPLVAWIPVLVIALLMAQLSYVAIERPFLTLKPTRLLRRLGFRRPVPEA